MPSFCETETKAHLSIVVGGSVGKIESQCAVEYRYSSKFNITRSTSRLYYMQSIYILTSEYGYIPLRLVELFRELFYNKN